MQPSRSNKTADRSYAASSKPSFSGYQHSAAYVARNWHTTLPRLAVTSSNCRRNCPSGKPKQFWTPSKEGIMACHWWLQSSGWSHQASWQEEGHCHLPLLHLLLQSPCSSEKTAPYGPYCVHAHSSTRPQQTSCMTIPSLQPQAADLSTKKWVSGTPKKLTQLCGIHGFVDLSGWCWLLEKKNNTELVKAWECACTFTFCFCTA